MTITDGSAEQLNTGNLTPQNDDLEHWLQDLRTELNGAPPDWVANDPSGGPAAAARFEANRLAFLDNDETKQPAREPKPVGRHRTPD